MMIMKKYTLILGFVLIAFLAQGQYVIRDASELSPLKEVPQELIYVNHTGPVVFTGEYLHYALHCFNAQTRRTSRISSVAYVAMIDQAGSTVFEHKVRLQRGKSYGDYFLPTSLETGTYKLVAYTQWMKNSGLKQLFQDDIAVINPYRIPEINQTSDTTDEMVSGTVNQDSSTVAISIDGARLNTRQLNSLRLNNFKGPLGKGTYSVWIKRKETVPFQRAKTASAWVSQYNQAAKRIPQTIGDSLFLPEQRGELLFGNARDSQGNPVRGERIYLSIPGEEFVLKFATTDDNGNFYSYVRERYNDPRVIMQAQGVSKEIELKLGTVAGLDYSGLEFASLDIMAALEKELVARSIRNQIENQFFEIKPDSILLDAPRDPFDGGMPETTLLDEYTRFPTFEETLVEIFSNAGYRNGPNGTSYIRIAQDYEQWDEPFNNDPALVLIDGVMIRDHGTIKEFNAGLIEKIELIRDQFQMADQAYQGMMVITTFDGDYADTFQALNSDIGTLQMARPEKNYYTEDHSLRATSRIPDYRNVLLWQPHIELDAEPVVIPFYTSDVPGTYEVFLEGFTDYGKPISGRLEFEVVADQP